MFPHVCMRRLVTVALVTVVTVDDARTPHEARLDARSRLATSAIDSDHECVAKIVPMRVMMGGII